MEDYFSPNINDKSGGQDADKNALNRSGGSAEACAGGGDRVGGNGCDKVLNRVQG